MSRINIFSLPSDPSSTAGSSSLREQIEAALVGTGQTVVPGSRPEDAKWAFKRSVPTVVLYDEEGLRLYDGITAHAPEYYLFNDELNLLKNHGDEIARSMGFPGRAPVSEGAEGQAEDTEEEAHRDRQQFETPEKPWKPARWGDVDVGKWNMGVNGEEGLAGGAEPGYDIVELGAGALRKTAYLLTALSGALAPSSTKEAGIAPITYHPLDLSKPELDRVLGEMNDEFGDRLQGKVDCIGLHGDYNAGLKFIREGRLSSLREAASKPCSLRGGGLGLDLDKNSRESSVAPCTVEREKDMDVSSTTPSSPPLTAASSGEGITPGPFVSPLPSAITDETLSVASRDGTWSPLHSESASPADPKATAGAPRTRPLHLVFLGSSLGNFPREEAAPFLRSLPLRPGDTLLLGLDGRPAPGAEGTEKVRVAYNDPAGHTRLFEEHGWDVVRQELGLQGDAGVEFVGRYNETLGRHEAYFRSLAAQRIHLPGKQETVELEDGELLNIEWSYKYSLGEAYKLFHDSHLEIINSWKAPDSEYRLWLLERPEVHFIESEMTPVQKNEVQLKGIPTWEQWEAMWKLWDHITLEMIPKEMLHQKPIDLRHICLFYLGHIPTFLDIHLTRLTKGQHTEPEHFKDIFERGIDPDVDDPTQIHDHSEVPAREEDWPTITEVLTFRDKVRARLRGIYDALVAGEMALDRHTGRVLFMTYEHEAMHAETLLYMLLQSPDTLPPTAVAFPQWEALSARWNAEYKENKVLDIPGGNVVMGHDDIENDDIKYTKPEEWDSHEFGWDNENPRISRSVAAFKVDSLPISNEEYQDFLLAKHGKVDKSIAPAGWIEVQSEWKIRTLYGPVPFAVGGKWPVTASKLELDAFAASKGGRLPTEEELRLLWEHPEGPRVAGQAANVGVKGWHPIPPAHTFTDNAGQVIHGHNGGVWEWTSSEFQGYPGFSPSKLYPGYSADFFDGKHFAVLGGSFATIPALAERKSFRNWYQSNYRFSFIGARVVYPA